MNSSEPTINPSEAWLGVTKAVITKIINLIFRSVHKSKSGY